MYDIKSSGRSYYCNPNPTYISHISNHGTNNNNNDTIYISHVSKTQPAPYGFGTCEANQIVQSECHLLGDTSSDFTLIEVGLTLRLYT